MPKPSVITDFLQSPAYRVSYSKDCYVLVVLFIFFCQPVVCRSWVDFRETFPHDAVCPEIVSFLLICSYVPPKNLSGENPQFSPICGPKLDTLRPAIPYNAGRIGKSKTRGSICG